jgi:hypothetical protein
MVMGNQNRTQAAPTRDIFAALREGFAFVHAKASHVRINEDRLASFADALPSKPPGNVLDVTHHFIGPPEEMASYILTLDSINFGSGYKPLLVKEGWKTVNGSLYFTISTRLKEYFERRGPLSPRALTEITPAQVAGLLGLDAAKTWSEKFSAICAANLHETGQLIERAYGGRFLNLIDKADGSAARFVGVLSSLPAFGDIHRYKGRDIPFYKRAQITAADLHLAFSRLGRILFDDVGRLTMFPDNAVPHILHMDGVLEYVPELAARIAAGEEIPSGSEPEVEIRACAAHAVELMAARKGMKAMDLDHILWHRSEEDPRYGAAPTHRTLSRFY